MDLFCELSEVVRLAGEHAPALPAPVVEGASDGDGWTWQWVLAVPETAEMALVFRPDAFDEKVLVQLIANVRSTKHPEIAWVQTYPVPHFVARRDHKSFAEQLGAHLRSAWDDINRNVMRLDQIKKRQEEAFEQFRTKGINIR